MEGEREGGLILQTQHLDLNPFPTHTHPGAVIVANIISIVAFKKRIY